MNLTLSSAGHETTTGAESETSDFTLTSSAMELFYALRVNDAKTGKWDLFRYLTLPMKHSFEIKTETLYAVAVVIICALLFVAFWRK